MSFIKRIFWSLLAILFPWLILLLDDNPGGALVAIVLQATIVGWIPAAIWAWRIANQNEKSSASKEEDNNKRKTQGE